MDANADFGNECDDGVVGLVPYEIHSSSEDSYDFPSEVKSAKEESKQKITTGSQ